MISPRGLWAGTLWAGKWCGKKGCGGRLADSWPHGPVKVLVTSGGDWRNCNRSGWWPLQPSLPVTIIDSKCGPRLLGERQRGEPTIGDVLDESEGSDCRSVLNIGSLMMKIERGCMSQYSCSRGSPVFELELHLLFLGIAPCGSVLRWVLCFCVNSLFLFKSGSIEQDFKMLPLTTVT